MNFDEIKNTSKNRTKNIIVFLKSRFFIVNFSMSVAALLLIVIIIGLWLRLYTMHGQEISVPDFTGFTVTEVHKMAKEKRLRIEIVDSVYADLGRKGAVIDQTPPPSFKVKKGRTIFLTIKAYNAENVSMPNLRGTSIVQARADIETYGLKIGKLTYRPDIAKDNVLEQMVNGKRIAPGTQIPRGTRIDLVLGLGNDDNAVASVPDLVGLNFYDASLLAAENSLNIGTVIFDNTVVSELDTAGALVYKQSPSENTVLGMGAQIDLWLTTDENKVKIK